MGMHVDTRWHLATKDNLSNYTLANSLACLGGFEGQKFATFIL